MANFCILTVGNTDLLILFLEHIAAVAIALVQFHDDLLGISVAFLDNLASIRVVLAVPPHALEGVASVTSHVPIRIRVFAVNFGSHGKAIGPSQITSWIILGAV